MDSGSWPLYAAVFFAAVALGALFSAIETAFSVVNQVRLRTFDEHGDRRAKRALKITENYDQAISTALIANNIMHTAAALTATLFAVRFFGEKYVTAATLIVTLLIFLFGEVLPKRYAKDRSVDFCLWCAPWFLRLMWIMRPVSAIFMIITRALNKRFPGEEEPTYTEEELQDIVENLEDEGVIEPDEQELVKSALEFGETRAYNILIPLDEVVTIPINAGKEDVISIIKRSRLSRFPVIVPRSGRIVGILMASRFLSACIKGEDTDIRGMLLPIKRYEKDIHIDDLMRSMSRMRQHMALIVDGSSKPLGIVTIEDILEELVGEIYDERDMELQEKGGKAQ